MRHFCNSLMKDCNCLNKIKPNATSDSRSTCHNLSFFYLVNVFDNHYICSSFCFLWANVNSLYCSIVPSMGTCLAAFLILFGFNLCLKLLITLSRFCNHTTHTRTTSVSLSSPFSSERILRTNTRVTKSSGGSMRPPS